MTQAAQCLLLFSQLVIWLCFASANRILNSTTQSSQSFARINYYPPGQLADLLRGVKNVLKCFFTDYNQVFQSRRCNECCECCDSARFARHQRPNNPHGHLQCSQHSCKPRPCCAHLCGQHSRNQSRHRRLCRQHRIRSLLQQPTGWSSFLRNVLWSRQHSWRVHRHSPLSGVDQCPAHPNG